MYKKILADFSAGVNFALAPLQLGLDSQKTFWANALNVEIFSRKGVCRQKGNALLARSFDGSAINSIFTFSPAKNPAAKKILYVTANGDFCEYDVQTASHNVLRHSLLNSKCIFAPFLSGVAVSNGADAPFFYQGDENGLPGRILDMNTVAKDGSSPILATAMCAYKSRLWLAAGDTLYYSALGMFDDWVSEGDAGYISNFHCDAAPVSAMRTYKDFLAVYKPAQTYLLSGYSPDDFAITPFCDKGANSHSAVVTADNKQFFFSDALFCLEQTGILAQISLGDEASLNIKPVLNNDATNLKTLKDNDGQAFAVGGPLDKMRLGEVIALAYEPKNQLWFYVPTQNNPHLNNIWIYDTLNRAWTLRGLPLPVSCAANYGEQIISATSDGRILLEDSSNTFAGIPISFEWKSPFLTLGNPNTRKVIDQFYLLISDAVDNNFDFCAFKDYDTLDAQDAERIEVTNTQNLLWASDLSEGEWFCWASEASDAGGDGEEILPSWGIDNEDFSAGQRWAVPCETAQKVEISLACLAVQLCISGSRPEQNFALLALEYKEVSPE